MLVEDCKGAAYLSIAALLFTIACYVVPSIGRLIDRSRDADEIYCGVQYDVDSHTVNIGFTAKNTGNEKDHPTAATADGHEIDCSDAIEK